MLFSSEAGAVIVDTLNVLVAPTAALIGALGGTAIANRRSAQRDRFQRAENRRDAARGSMVELLHSGRAWSLENARRGLGSYMQARSPIPNGPSAVEEWAERESALRRPLEEAFIDVLLRVDDLELREAVSTCRETMTLSMKLSSVIGQKARDNEPDVDDTVDEMFKLGSQFDSQLETLEAAAIRYFAAPID